MAFDGIITKKVISELNNILAQGKINKVTQPNTQEVVLNVYSAGNNYNLLLCANPEFCRIGTTEYLKHNPQNAYGFCMLLRKYLVGGKILEFKNYDLERTVEVKIECYNELNDIVVRKLFIEIMSRQSNIILTNENNIIIDSLKHIDSSSRELLPAHEYTFSPINRISFIETASYDDFYNAMTTNKDDSFSISKQMSNTYIGISKSAVKEILKILNIDDHDSSYESLVNVYNYYKSIIEKIPTNELKCFLINKGKDYGYKLDEPSNESILEFLDNFYFEKEQKNLFSSTKNNLLKIVLVNLKKVTKKLENINTKLQECNNLDKYRLYGELLTANIYRFKDLPNTESVTVENYYDENKEITIPLDKKLGYQKNIERYFKRYDKLKNASAIVSIQKKETEAEINYIESIVFSIDEAKTLEDLTEIYDEISEAFSLNQKQKSKVKNEKLSKDLKYDIRNINGYDVYVGKNNKQNDYISLRLAQGNDVWFHVQKYHGSHVLLRNPNNQEIDEDTLFKCACLAKENSKAAESLNVPVDYCLAKFVKKQSGSKPGMVNYTNFSTIIVK